MTKKDLEDKEKEIVTELRHLEEVEYGIKELIHGLVIGIIIGFILAWFILK